MRATGGGCVRILLRVRVYPVLAAYPVGVCAYFFRPKYRLKVEKQVLVGMILLCYSVKDCVYGSGGLFFAVEKLK